MMQQPPGEDALRMWLVEARGVQSGYRFGFALVEANAKSMTKIYNETDDIILQDAYE
ncbi:hypothetical protein YC2023_065110 [Brassica napus]